MDTQTHAEGTDFMSSTAYMGGNDIRLRLINSLFLMAGLVGFRLIFKNKKKMYSDIFTVKQENLRYMTILQFFFFPGGRVGFTMSKS